tara:strand:+ start:1106 stop:2125 length:1020 start_codon:yes stop_codon:yes gene_type:complete
MPKINVLIAGSTGYIGIQLVKLLCKHKKVNIKYLCGNTSVGKNISFFDKSLKKYKLPKISKLKSKNLKEVDVIFTSLPNGESKKIANKLDENKVLIDLAADFRLKNRKIYKRYYGINTSYSKKNFKSIYGLPELKKKQIKKFKIIACPGCYPTSILIPLYPLLNKKLVDHGNIIIDSKSGYSGAGRGVHKKYKDKNLYGSTSAYGIPNHRHNAEIQQELDLINKKIQFTFTPHILPMFRGIISSLYINLKKGITANKVFTTLKNFYKKDEFIKVQNLNKMLSTNDVINTNNLHISVCKSKEKNKIIILSTLDNLIKGGAGQAVQNLNIIFNYKINEGLK